MIFCMGASSYASCLDGHQIRQYTVNDGLSSNAIYSISQDSKGRMWFGTIDGLHSYDGASIRQWRDSSIPTLGSVIYNIVEDKEDRLWIASNAGLAILDLRKEKFTTLDINPESGVGIKSRVTDVMRDFDGNMWLATAGQGVFRYDPRTRILKQYPAITKINSDLARCLMQDSSGMIWVGTVLGVSRYNPVQDRFMAIESSDKGFGVSSLFEDSRHNIWAGASGQGLFLYDPDSNTFHQKLSPSDSNSLLQVRAIKEWRPGELMLASDQGLTCYDVKSGESELVRAYPGRVNSLSDNYLQSLFVDREGALWVGSYFGGVNYVAPSQGMFQHYYNGNTDLGARIVSVLAEAEGGNLWVGSDDAGVFHWDKKSNSFTPVRNRHLDSGSAYKNIHSLLQVGDKLMIGMYMGGLDVLDLKTGNLKNYMAGSSSRSLYSSSIYSILKDGDGRIWIGASSGLNRYCPETDDFERIFEVHPADIACIIEDKRGYIWVSTSDMGMYRMEKKTGKWQHLSFDLENPENSFGLLTNSIVTAHCDKAGDLWVGTDGAGLFRYDYESGKFLQEKLPIHGIRVVNKILSDDKRLWLATTNGLYCYSPKDSTIFYYNKESGLQDDVFLPNSGIRADDGTMYLGGINGFNEFNPDQIIHRLEKPEVILTDFQIFNHPVGPDAKDSPLEESITYASGLTLSHKQRMVSFRVSPMSFVNPGYNRFLYKLDGFDKDWIEADSRHPLTYTNLPAGNYTLRVRTSDGNGGWNDDSLAFPIRMLPPWWLSLPMVCVYVLAIVALLLLVYLRIMRRQKEKLRNLADVKDRELYKSKMEFFTYIVHEIRTPLTLILSPFENLLRSEGKVADHRSQLLVMERNAKRLLHLVNHLMDFRKIEAGGMKLIIRDIDIKEVLDDVSRNFIPSAQLKNIEVSLSLPDDKCIASVDREAFIEIVSNLLSNAHKFAKSYIGISLRATDDGKFRLCIGNDGPEIPKSEQDKIFTAFYQIEETRPSDNIGTGIGLLLVKKYAGMMNASVSVNSGDGTGTEFIVDFMAAKNGAVNDSLPMKEIGMELETDAKIESSEKRDRILIVDDNKDMVDFLSEILSEDYDVDCSENADDAQAKIKELIPDLVISDIMMPGTNGIELCRLLKHNINTSHVPVVLLTAKVENIDFVKGFETGADLYVTKPFSTDVLKAQIHSLLLNREILRKRFASDPDVIDDLVSNSGLDKAFFEKVKASVEEKYSDPEYSVDVMARDAAISRTGLFTKIKALTGMTPNEYIRMVRLQKAERLLATTDMRVNEVCWQVGFSSRSHFAKCFQQKYGVNPSDYKSSRMRQTPA